MRSITHTVFCVLGLSVILSITASLGFSQTKSQYSLNGKVINGTTMKPVVSAVVIVNEVGMVGYTRQDGSYAIEIPKAGSYTLKIQAPGYTTVITKITIDGNVTRDFTLTSGSTRGSGVTVRGERDIQKISRQTMTVEQIKKTPGTLGDSINALASLPGVNRPMGFFGPLIIRGADELLNGYFIDDIPLLKPMHFGGIHSVISNDLIKEIDLYSSAYPAQFQNAQAAVININTKDEVKRAGGVGEIGLISANVLVETPIMQTKIVDGKAVDDNRGYLIASGRYGYLSLFIPPLYKAVMHKKLDSVPDYWDYQFKAKYKLTDNNSITFLTFGSRDYIKAIEDDSASEGADPAFEDMEFKMNSQSHGQGLYYTFNYGDSFSNTLLGYALENKMDYFVDAPKSTASWVKNFRVSSCPNIFAVKDKIKIDWIKDHAILRAGVEFADYRYSTKGKRLVILDISSGDMNDPDTARTEPINETVSNYLTSGYVENKFSIGGLLFIPGIHSEHLSRTKDTTFDPRGVISYTLPTNTTIGFAGGKYSKFMQPNLHFFAVSFAPEIAADKKLKPQKSYHRSVSIEQKISEYTFRIEGFYNNFWDVMERDQYTDSSGTVHNVFANRGKAKTKGIEVMAKISDEHEQGLFGWISYTYNTSKYRRDVNDPTDNDSHKWLDSYWEMLHVAKVVTGYTMGRHTLSAKFQYNSSLPYTPIVGSNEDTDFMAATGKPRNVPVYGESNSKRDKAQYELDLRYTYTTKYSWGHIAWFIDIMNATNYQTREYTWDYRYAYSSKNPKFKKSNGIALLPTFGVEAKF